MSKKEFISVAVNAYLMGVKMIHAYMSGFKVSFILQDSTNFQELSEFYEEHKNNIANSESLYLINDKTLYLDFNK